MNFIIGAPQLLLIICFFFIVNLPIYGLANRNIASTAGRDTKSAFWLGLLGPLGTIICLLQCVNINLKKVASGIGRFFIWSIVSAILAELEMISIGFQQVILYSLGIPFILRGKNVFRFSITTKQ